MKNLSYILLFFPLAFVAPEDETLQKFRQQWHIYENNQPHESVYLSVSEEVVMAGDTAWFAGYLRHSGSASRVLYVELVSDQGTRQKGTYYIKDSFVSGQISIPDSLSSGFYQLRAYTQWMRNGEERTFFSRPLLVINPYDDNPPPPAQGQLMNTRLRLVPESGQWVSDLPARLRVELGGKENQRLKGRILMQQDSASVVDFQLEKGMAMLSLRPETGTSYRAEVFLPSGDTLRTLLPPPREKGVSLMADLQDGRLDINAYTKGGVKHYLLVHSQDTLLHSSLLEDTATTLTLRPDVSTSGLLEVAVLDEQAQVLAQRYLYHHGKPLLLDISLDKTQYAAREKVTATFSLPEGISAAGLSLSVRKVNAFSQAYDISNPWTSELPPTMANMSQAWVNQWLVGRESTFTSWQEVMATKPQPPEFRKEDEYFLLSGKLTDTSGKPLKNEMALLSVPGYNPHFDYDRTDSLGRFHLPVYDVFGEKQVVFQLKNDSLKAEWSLEDKFAAHKPQSVEANTQTLLSAEAWKQVLAQYRQRNRILTQYEKFFKEKEDDIARKSRFYGEPNFKVRLEDYVSLPDFVEVCRELMPGIRLRKEDGHYVFSVFDVRTRTFLENPPALLLDGVLIDDPDIVVSLDPSDIDRIETVNRRTYYGEYRFDGMIAVYTERGDAYLDALPPSARQKEITFFTPLHAFQSREVPAIHQPDFRTLLLWEPKLALKPREKRSLSFQNGDELGEFIIVAEGLTSDGKAIYGARIYRVGTDQFNHE